MKIIPVYRFCSACWGVGKVEHIPHEQPDPKDPNKDRTDICYVCNGNGHIPTGEFVFEHDNTKRSFLDALKLLPEDIQKSITRRR